MEVLSTILTNILTAVYQPLWFALLLSVIFMFAWKNYGSVKEAAKQWVEWFKSERSFRKMFLLAFYVTLVLFRTLFNRNMWSNPLNDVIGTWSLFVENSKGEMVLSTEVPENIVLFIPFGMLLLWNYRERLMPKEVTFLKVIRISFVASFLFSLLIETLQLILRLGAWQLSDLADNTAGGIIGGMLYFALYKISIAIKEKKK